ncbi:hypothetical protein NX059_007253 [Plenodomus lindquistii]|nr:hypothetical protein NX059_007253 [Plenodomus lindquistii]
MHRLIAYILSTCALLFSLGTDAQSSDQASSACTINVYTETVDMVLGQYTARRRVVYETSKPISADRYDTTMYALGLTWGDNKEGMSL